MKYFLMLSIAIAIALAGCSTDDSAPADSAAVQSQPDQTAQDPVTPEPDATLDAEDLQPQMVEESASEPDEDQAQDQPILLAQAEPGASAQSWQFQQGEHFFRLQSTQPVIGGPDKIEVAEIFWYGCGHCYDFEPHINRWVSSKPDNVRFVRIPATWNPLVKLHAQLYYTEEVLVKNGKIADPAAFRAAVFAEYHRRGNRMTSESSIQKLFERQGVSAEDFSKTWKSFEVSAKLNKAQDLAIRYGITGVPAVVVNGKYRTGAGEAGGYPKLLEVIDELVAREAS